MADQKRDAQDSPRADATLIERYRPLGLKAVLAAALHIKPKAKTDIRPVASARKQTV